MESGQAHWLGSLLQREALAVSGSKMKQPKGHTPVFTNYGQGHHVRSGKGVVLCDMLLCDLIFGPFGKLIIFIETSPLTGSGARGTF